MLRCDVSKTWIEFPESYKPLIIKSSVLKLAQRELCTQMPVPSTEYSTDRPGFSFSDFWSVSAPCPQASAVTFAHDRSTRCNWIPLESSTHGQPGGPGEGFVCLDAGQLAHLSVSFATLIWLHACDVLFTSR
jgi:hypothetical protein